MIDKSKFINQKSKLTLITVCVSVFIFGFFNPVLAAQSVVNDPGYTEDSRDIDKQWGLSRVGFTSSWSKTSGSLDNVVAILDTGVDATHEDLKNINFVEGYDFIARKAIVGKINSDDNGHGTLVTGILAATPNNGVGIAGTNRLVTIMPIKVLDSEGKGQAAVVAEGIRWAADHGAQFINLSLGGSGFPDDSSLSGAITYAYKKNVLIVAAAGNDSALEGLNLDTKPAFPICDDNNSNMILGVTVSDSNDLKPEFANFGKNCVDVMAPGKRILSTINYDPITKIYSPNSYAYGSGTSLAVPLVVGQAALIRSVFPQATNSQIRDRIISTADNLDALNMSQCGGVSCKGLLGAGRINVFKSLQGDLVPNNIKEGELLRAENSNTIYFYSGGQKRLISSFVYNQRFLNNPVNVVKAELLSSLPESSYAMPLDGTLVKWHKEPTVFFISHGKKHPVSFGVFKQRGFDFKNVSTVSFEELNSWSTGSFLVPTEGILVKSQRNNTLYFVLGQVLHPVSREYYIDKGLSVLPVFVLSDLEIKTLPKGDPFVR
jgi:hypothetical protein